MTTTCDPFVCHITPALAKLCFPPISLGPRLTDPPLSSNCTGNGGHIAQLPQECKSEQAAVIALGYTKLSWENKSGKEKQPSSADKGWDELTDREKAAAARLGYTGKMWDNEEVPPAMEKEWDELTSGGMATTCQPFIS